MVDALNTPTKDAIEAAWNRAEALHAESPFDPRYAATKAALGWVTGRTQVAPISGDQRAAGPDDIRLEAHYAGMVELGIREGDPAYGAAAAKVLFWCAGIEKMPYWLRRRLD